MFDKRDIQKLYKILSSEYFIQIPDEKRKWSYEDFHFALGGGGFDMNDEPIFCSGDFWEARNYSQKSGGETIESVSSIKKYAPRIYSSQNRAVTADDFSAMVYRMPAKYGRVKRAKLLRDHDSFKRNLNLYVLRRFTSFLLFNVLRLGLNKTSE